MCSSLKPECLFGQKPTPFVTFLLAKSKDEKTKALQVAEEAADIYKDDDWVVVSNIFLCSSLYGEDSHFE